MKKFLSVILSLSMILALSVPAFAAEAVTPTSNTTRPGIIGEIFYEETTPSATIKGSANSTPTPVLTTLSGTVNNDGSVSTYQYENNKLIEYHTTIPGSRVVTSVYIDETGTKSAVQTVISPTGSISTPSATVDSPTLTRSSTALKETEILSPTSVHPLGFMHYRHHFTDEIFSINCEVREKYHGYEYYTFNKGAAESLSFWTNSIISIFAFHKALANKMANAIFQRCVSYGILGYVVNKGYEVFITRKIPCYWYDQEIHGTPTAPQGRGSDRYLPGVFAYVNYGNGLEKRTEGYTVSDWGNPSMGRWMMYNVFGIDEAPTSWTNLE